MLERRREQGAGLIERIEDALEEMQTPKARQKNVIAEALIEDVNEHLGDIEEDALIDAFVLAAVQKTEHYCIAAWGTARSLAQALGNKTTVKVMERALKEGKRLDDKLTELAESEINPTMMKGTGEAEEGEEKAEGEAQRRGRSGGSRRRTSGRSGASARSGKAR
jgi:ferritin-like metal-binding protein YciE